MAIRSYADVALRRARSAMISSSRAFFVRMNPRYCVARASLTMAATFSREARAGVFGGTNSNRAALMACASSVSPRRFQLTYSLARSQTARMASSRSAAGSSAAAVRVGRHLRGRRSAHPVSFEDQRGVGRLVGGLRQPRQPLEELQRPRQPGHRVTIAGQQRRVERERQPTLRCLQDAGVILQEPGQAFLVRDAALAGEVRRRDVVDGQVVEAGQSEVLEIAGMVLRPEVGLRPAGPGWPPRFSWPASPTAGTAGPR